MGRRARNEILFDGCFAHVLSRSFDNQQIYQDADDFETFKTLLLESKRRAGFLLHHYCLMHTHFHFLLSIPEIKKFSSALQWLKHQYTVSYNHRHKRTGPLWRERFKSLVVEDEAYLSACGLYVEENPVKAGLVSKSEDWPHSSAAYYLSGRTDALIDPYEFDGSLEKLPSIREAMFTQGSGIGSELFLLHLEEGVLNEVSVP